MLDGERGPQLVSGIGDEPFVRGERRLEPAEEPVDGVGQVLQLVARAGQRRAARARCASEICCSRSVIVSTGRSTRPAMSQPRRREITARMASAIQLG